MKWIMKEKAGNHLLPCLMSTLLVSCNNISIQCVGIAIMHISLFQLIISKGFFRLAPTCSSVGQQEWCVVQGSLMGHGCFWVRSHDDYSSPNLMGQVLNISVELFHPISVCAVDGLWTESLANTTCSVVGQPHRTTTVCCMKSNGTNTPEATWVTLATEVVHFVLSRWLQKKQKQFGRRGDSSDLSNS